MPSAGLPLIDNALQVCKYESHCAKLHLTSIFRLYLWGYSGTNLFLYSCHSFLVKGFEVEFVLNLIQLSHFSTGVIEMKCLHTCLCQRHKCTSNVIQVMAELGYLINKTKELQTDASLLPFFPLALKCRSASQ